MTPARCYIIGFLYALHTSCAYMGKPASVGQCIRGTCGAGLKCIEGNCYENGTTNKPEDLITRIKRDSIPLCGNNMPAVAACHIPYAQECRNYQSNMYGCCGRNDLVCENSPTSNMNLCCSGSSAGPAQPAPPAVISPSMCQPPYCNMNNVNCQYNPMPGCNTLPTAPFLPPTQPAIAEQQCIPHFVSKFQQWVNLCPEGQSCFNSKCVPSECKPKINTNINTCPPETRPSYPCASNYYCSNYGRCINGQCCQPNTAPMADTQCPPGSCTGVVSGQMAPPNPCCGPQYSKRFYRL